MKQLYAMLRNSQAGDRCGMSREHPDGLVQGCVGNESVVVQRRGGWMLVYLSLSISEGLAILRTEAHLLNCSLVKAALQIAERLHGSLHNYVQCLLHSLKRR